MIHSPFDNNCLFIESGENQRVTFFFWSISLGSKISEINFLSGQSKYFFSRTSQIESQVPPSLWYRNPSPNGIINFFSGNRHSFIPLGAKSPKRSDHQNEFFVTRERSDHKKEFFYLERSDQKDRGKGGILFPC